MKISSGHMEDRDFPLCLRVCSVVYDSVTLWTVAHQAPLPMGFFRQEYWSGLPCPPSRELPISGIKLRSLISPEIAGGFFTIRATWEAPFSSSALKYTQIYHPAVFHCCFQMILLFFPLCHLQGQLHELHRRALCWVESSAVAAIVIFEQGVYISIWTEPANFVEGLPFC